VTGYYNDVTDQSRRPQLTNHGAIAALCK
jgi:hypothetical protein